MKKRSLAILLLLALLATGCAGSGGNEQETNGSLSDESSQSESTDEAESLELPSGLDYGGYTFRILSRPGIRVNEVFSENTDDVLSDAVYKRNLAVSDLLNVTFKVYESSCDWESDALKPILAGDDEYDAVATHARYAFEYGYNNAALDWNNVENIDLTKSWWNQDAAKNLTIAGRLFQMDGAISYATIQSSCCVVFNKELLDNYQIDYPYELVEQGKWTFDRFYEMAGQFAQDLNNDGAMKFEDDQFGYMTHPYVGPVQVLSSAGCRIVTVDNDGYPQLTLYSDRTVSVFDKYMGMLKENFTYVVNDSEDRGKALGEGRAAFIDVSIGALSGALRATETDFGVIPWPKWDETVDKYYANVDAGHSMWIIPTTVQDVPRTGAVLEAMAYYGKKFIIPAYYDVTLQNKYLRDEKSIDMLDYIYEGAVYDLAYYNSSYIGGNLANPGYNLALDPNLTFSAFYAKNESATKKLIEKSMETYQTLD